MVSSDRPRFFRYSRAFLPSCGLVRGSSEEARASSLILKSFSSSLRTWGRTLCWSGRGTWYFSARLLQGLGKGQVLLLHDQREDVPADAAAEAVVELFVLVDGERRRLFGVERAETDLFPAPPLQGRVLGGDLDDGRGLPDLVDDLHECYLDPRVLIEYRDGSRPCQAVQFIIISDDSRPFFRARGG